MINLNLYSASLGIKIVFICIDFKLKGQCLIFLVKRSKVLHENLSKKLSTFILVAFAQQVLEKSFDNARGGYSEIENYFPMNLSVRQKASLKMPPKQI